MDDTQSLLIHLKKFVLEQDKNREFDAMVQSWLAKQLLLSKNIQGNKFKAHSICNCHWSKNNWTEPSMLLMFMNMKLDPEEHELQGSSYIGIQQMSQPAQTPRVLL